MLELGGALLVLIVLGAVLLIGIAGWGVFLLLVQLGVIVQKAAEPPATDSGGYSLAQSRDVGEDRSREGL